MTDELRHAVMDPSAWTGLASDPRILVTVRKGDAEDPLAGIVRIEADGQRAIDVVVRRWSWQAEAVAAARWLADEGLDAPTDARLDPALIRGRHAARLGP